MIFLGPITLNEVTKSWGFLSIDHGYFLNISGTTNSKGTYLTVAELPYDRYALSIQHADLNRSVIWDVEPPTQSSACLKQ
jgi:hypothetical protein